VSLANDFVHVVVMLPKAKGRNRETAARALTAKRQRELRASG